MGTANLGIPQAIALELAQLNGSTVFVETGTFKGNTTRWAAGIFEAVHTIERSEILYELHSDELAAIGNVTPHLGDSREILPKIIGGLGGKRALYWLDGHWSGGQTAGELDECPLLGELTCLRDRTEDIILIDDARFFLCAPPVPHNPSQWPTISDVIDALPDLAGGRFVQIVDDVIFIIPNDDDLKSCLINYAQKRSSECSTSVGGSRWMRFLPNVLLRKTLQKARRR